MVLSIYPTSLACRNQLPTGKFFAPLAGIANGGEREGKEKKGEEKERRRKRKKKEERLFPSVSISGSTKTTPHFDHHISPLI
jgi:hypothetical protein